jgi:hypothetical protein
VGLTNSYIKVVQSSLSGILGAQPSLQQLQEGFKDSF